MGSLPQTASKSSFLPLSLLSLCPNYRHSSQLSQGETLQYQTYGNNPLRGQPHLLYWQELPEGVPKSLSALFEEKVLN
jgi:hypothetical protein